MGEPQIWRIPIPGGAQVWRSPRYGGRPVFGGAQFWGSQAAPVLVEPWFGAQDMEEPQVTFQPYWFEWVLSILIELFRISF